MIRWKICIVLKLSA